jgi:hypothetical protein
MRGEFEQSRTRHFELKHSTNYVADLSVLPTSLHGFNRVAGRLH